MHGSLFKFRLALVPSSRSATRGTSCQEDQERLPNVFTRDVSVKGWAVLQPKTFHDKLLGQEVNLQSFTCGMEFRLEGIRKWHAFLPQTVRGTPLLCCSHS